MHGCDSGPHRACDVVLLLHEGGEERRLLLALAEEFGRQPEAGAGTKEREVQGAARTSQPSTNRSDRVEPSRRPSANHPHRSARRMMIGASSKIARAHCSPVRSWAGPVSTRKASSSSTWGSVLRVRAAGGTATRRTLPGVSTCGSFGWLSVPAVKSISCVDTEVLLAGWYGIIRTCMYALHLR
jgi:hypothetical protein